jgi:hypothetical protein
VHIFGRYFHLNSDSCAITAFVTRRLMAKALKPTKDQEEGYETKINELHKMKKSTEMLSDTEKDL